MSREKERQYRKGIKGVLMVGNASAGGEVYQCG